MKQESDEPRSLPITPTWSVAIVLTLFVVVSLSVERSIHRLSSWLRKTNRKPLFEALERMKEELMLLGFMSLLLTATSRTISSICIDKKFYGSNFAPCSKSEIEKSEEESPEDSPKERKLLMASALHQSLRRGLIRLSQNTCKHDHEPFVSLEGLEQLHRFIFVMAVTHITYSCLTMLLAIIKVHSWRSWEDEAHIDRRGGFPETARESTIKRQSLFVKFHLATPWGKNGFFVWVTCFFRQFANSVVRADYLTLRMGFITNHNLSPKYDFHSYMIRTMEEEFQRIVGVSGPLWGFVVAFMLFNVKGSNLYFWIAVIPTARNYKKTRIDKDYITPVGELIAVAPFSTISLVLALGTKLQRIIATLAWENAGVTGFFTETRLKPRDELFWFNKPELILSFIHFVLFQNAFEMASFLWFWWQFGYHSCFNSNHPMLYTRLIVGLASQFLCSYSTLPLYALVTQMGTNYKAAMIPESVRETIHGWNKATKKKRRRGNMNDDSTVHTETSTVISFDDDESQMCDSPTTGRYADIELAPISTIAISPRVVPNEGSSRVGTPLLKSSGSNFSSTYLMTQERSIIRSPSRSPPTAVQRRGPME